MIKGKFGGGLTPTITKEGDVRVVAESSPDKKKAQVAAPLSIGVLVNKAFPHNAASFSSDAAIDKKLAALAQELNKESRGSGFAALLVGVYQAIHNDPNLATTVTIEGLKTYARAAARVFDDPTGSKSKAAIAIRNAVVEQEVAAFDKLLTSGEVTLDDTDDFI